MPDWAAIAAAALAFAAPVGGDDGGAALLHLRALDQRVASVGYRLAVASSASCTPVPLAGIVLHDIGEYRGTSREDARRTFGLGDAPQVEAVAAGSPAAGAGIAAGDTLLALGGAPVIAFGDPAQLDAILEAEAADGVFDVTLARGRLRVPLEKGCPTRFMVRVSDSAEAEADGRYVAITSAYVERADSDDALAIVLAHELAHNLLGHRVRLERQNVHYGLAQHFGRNARLIRETEIEADRLSVALVARAGFDVARAIAFRERQWRDPAQTILNSPTHPAPGARLAVLREEVARIAVAGAGTQ